MSGNEFALIALAETTRQCVQLEEIVEENEDRAAKLANGKEKKEKCEKKTLLRRLPSFRSTLSFNMGRLRSSFRSVNCFKTDEKEKIPLMPNIPKARRSLDIGVGLARRMSLFIFTKKTVCAHPYHPYYPEQTTRKIYVYHEEN